MTSETPQATAPAAVVVTRILVADDEEPIRNLLSKALGKLGFEVTLAEDGVEALSLWRSDYFSAVILDIRMPGKDGVEVMETIRQSDQAVPIIFITGNPDLNSARRAIVSGATDYLLKPFDIVELRSRVTRAIEALELRRENERQHEELQRQHEELERRYAKILTLENKRAQLFHLLVGEMCEPLTELKFQLELVTSGLVGEVSSELKDLLEAAGRDVQRLWKITRDLFDLHMLEAGNLYQGSNTTFGLVEALEEGAHSGHLLCLHTDKGEVRVAVEPDFEVEHNRDLIVRAVASLVCVLVEFSPRGAVTRVDGQQDDAGGFSIRISSDSVPVGLDAWQDGFLGGVEALAEAGLSAPGCLGLPLARQITEVVGGEFLVDVNENSAAEQTCYRIVLTMRLPGGVL